MTGVLGSGSVDGRPNVVQIGLIVRDIETTAQLDFIHFDLTGEQDKLWHLPTKEDGQCLPCPEDILP